MSKKIFLLSFAFILIFTACQKDEKLQYGETAPNIKLLNLKDEVKQLKNYKNKLIILRFWQEGCASCLEEMPVLDAIYKKHKKELIVVSIGMGSNKKFISNFQKENNISFPMLIDQLLIATKKYDVKVSPTTFIIDKEGILRQKIIGDMDPSKLKRKILSYL